MISNRIRAAIIAFHAPQLVSGGFLEADIDNVLTGLERIKSDGETNLENCRAAIRTTCEGTIDAAINSVRRDMERDEDQWWDGYDAALADTRHELQALKATLLTQLSDAMV